MNNKKIVFGLGYKSLENYVIENSSLKKEQFVFVMFGGDGYAHFLVAKDNQIIDLGQFYYNLFIPGGGSKIEGDLIAITRFLDLCIKKLEDPKIEVPMLTGNPDMWDVCYKK